MRFFIDGCDILFFQLVELTLSLLDHLVSLLKLTVVARLIALVSLIKTLSHLNFALLDGQLHLSLQLKQLILVVSFTGISLAPFTVKISFALNLKFLNLQMVSLHKVFAPFLLDDKLVAHL